MDIGQQNLDMAACGEKFGNLHHGHEVTAMRTSCCSCSPVDFERTLFLEDDIVDDVLSKGFGEIGVDESN